MTTTNTITPAMCVAASDAAMERGIILPASHAGEIIEAALRAATAPAPAAESVEPQEALAALDHWRVHLDTPAPSVIAAGYLEPAGYQLTEAGRAALAAIRGRGEG